MSSGRNSRNSHDSGDSVNSSISRSSRERKDCLKQALEQTLILRDAINATTINKLNEAICEADNVTSETSIHEKICNQQEVLIDSQMMISSSKVIKTCAISLTKRMREYDHVDFAQKVVSSLQDDAQSVDWSLLEKRITKLFKRIPDYSTLLGTLEPLEKKVVNKKKPERRIAQQAAMIVPDKVVSQTNIKEEDSVEQTMQKIRKLIIYHCKETQEPLDLFKLIIHPHDFGRTIRNLLYNFWHASSPFRRQPRTVVAKIQESICNISIDLDDHGSLVVQPCRRTASQQDTQFSDRTGAQTVISLNMKQWDVLKKAYKLTEPMMDFDEGN